MIIRRAGCAISIVLLLCGCEGSLEHRVVLEGGRLSVVPPEGWTVEEEERGSATVIAGPNGRLSVALLDVSPTVSEPRDLLKTLGAIAPGFEVTNEDDFAAEAVMGKEFVVSYRDGDTAGKGIVYMFNSDGKLCILTFTGAQGDDDKGLDVFRASAGSLRFLAVN